MTNAEPKNLVDMFLSQAARHADRVALRHKSGGEWKGITWREWERDVKKLALGFLKLGIKPGEAVSIAANNRPEWLIVDLAVQMAGGILVPIYGTLPPDEIQYIHENSRVRFAVVENAGQLHKLRSVVKSLPNVGGIILIDGHSDDPRVMTYADLLESGAGGNEAVLVERFARLGPGDVATHIYTSGTTSRPKGAMITHGNILFNSEALTKLFDMGPGDSVISYLPLSHAYERVAGEYTAMRAGIEIWFAESIDRLGANLLEVRPTIMCAVPRVLEKVYAGIQAKIASGGRIARLLFEWALSVGREAGPFKVSGRPLPTGLALKHRVAKALVYDKIAARFGGRLRLIGVAAAPMSREIMEFFNALNITVLEGYGMTECAAPATINTPTDFKLGTVGRPLTGLDLKIADDGEILLRGPSVFAGYFGKPEATAEVLRDGWLYTGDIGEIDGDGRLLITDRKKDILITAGGKNVAPQKIENMLVADPFIAQAMVVGDRRPYLTALIVPRGFEMPDRAAATRDQRVIDAVRGRVEEINKRLAKFETIKDFRLLPADMTMETGELTPTLKLKRKVVREKYNDLIEEMYKKGMKDEG